MKRILSTQFLFVPAIVFAASGMADRFNDHQNWVFPAYAYCLGFGLTIMLILTILTRIYKAKTKMKFDAISAYLTEHSVYGIIVAGIIWSIILGIAVAVLGELLWFLVIFPVMFIIFLFPFNLAVKKSRDKWLLSPTILKWTAIISISAILASVLFIILTKCGILKGTETEYFQFRYNHPLVHPYDSMREIWLMVPFFIAETGIVIALYWLGKIYQYLCKRFIKRTE